ncbi:neural cell adhesion molecule 1-like isoform X3 [Acanthaster planci]|uniref:Neural cell adhesion molecule 1-like isoform X3 n=1 Tax=Acanthaster planci TaxID=133434 RepID=A0A8B7ZGR3_ACAPL|nr:neural cell adhesion molecule 1-like isoform X3 [Acanthaster planci]
MLSWKLVLLALYAVGFSDAALKIEPIYPTFNVPEYGSATTTCTNMDLFGTQPEWVDPYGQVVGPAGGGGSNDKQVSFHTNPDTGLKYTRMHLSNILKAASGGYVCRADGETQSININVYIPVTLVNEDAEKSQWMTYHESGSLLCTMRGEANTVVSWDGPNGPITDGGRYLITDMYGLTIDNVTLNDEGSYNCRGSIPDIGVATVLTIQADVYMVPKIRYPPINKNATEGTSAFFTCEAIGEPQPDYTWYDGSEALEDPAKYLIEEDGKRLTILNLEKDDQKRYTCQVSNPAGYDRRDGVLTVDIPPTPTRAVTQEKDERESVTFFCDIMRGDRENLALQFKRYEKWLPMGVQVDSRIVIQQETGTGPDAGQPGSLSLTITDIHRGDEGDYTCFARNNGGYAMSHHFLHVRYAPVINLDYSTKKVYSWIGHQLNLTCHWYGYPVPIVYWFVNSQPLVGTIGDVAGNATIYDFNNGSSSLFIDTKDSDFRPYQCDGRNKFGRVRHHIQFERAYPMKRPTNVRAISASSTAIQISFDNPVEVGADFPEYLRILGYVIGYSEYQQPTEMYEIIQNMCEPTAFQCGLLCIEKERRCDNFMDCLDNSDEENCNPQEDCPGGFKCPVRDGNLNPCLPLAYVCDQQADCVDGADESEESCSAYYRPIFYDMRLKGLAPDRIYQFRVAVMNEVGWGEWSFNTTERTLDYGPPSEPMIFNREPERNTMYEVVWLEPYDNGGSPILSYELTYSRVETADAKEHGRDPLTVPASKESETAPVFRHTLTNLERGTFYFLELRAVSTWGKSSPGTLNFRMPGGAPIPPPSNEPLGPGLRIGDLPLAAFIGIVVGSFLVILILLDCLCYCTNSCGLTMCICVHLCGKQSPEAKEEMEAVEYSAAMSTAGNRMAMQRLKDFETESHAVSDGTTHPLTDLSTLPAPIYGDLQPPSVPSIYSGMSASANHPSYRGYMYPSSEPTYANSDLFDNTDPRYRNEKMELERDLKNIFS